MLDPKTLLKKSFSYQDIDIVKVTSTREINSQIEADVAVVWKEKYREAIQQGKKIWDSDLYRFEKLEIKDNKVVLTLSIVKFNFVYGFQNSTYFQSSNPTYFAQHFSVGAMIKTKDNKFIFGERGNKTVAMGKIDIIGGALSADEFQLTSGEDIQKALSKEIKEEINISPEHIKSNHLIGMISSFTSNVIILSQINLDVDSTEVIQTFKLTNDEEMKKLLFIDEEKVNDYLISLGGYKPLLVDLLHIVNKNQGQHMPVIHTHKCLVVTDKKDRFLIVVEIDKNGNYSTRLPFKEEIVADIVKKSVSEEKNNELLILNTHQEIDVWDLFTDFPPIGYSDYGYVNFDDKSGEVTTYWPEKPDEKTVYEYWKILKPEDKKLIEDAGF